MAAFAIVKNLDRSIEDPPRVRLCGSFLCRLRGLMFRSGLPLQDGLLLVAKRDSRLDTSIHMLFVPFDLAVFWVNGALEVVDKAIARAWHPAYLASRPARYVLEVHPDLYSAYEVGDHVEIVDD
jgi:uncharacterized membrane protein (UPF0127 family)